MVTEAYLDQELLNAVLPGADFEALTGRIYPLERCIIVPRYAYEIVTLCGDLISITIELDNGNLPVFHLGMDDISPLDKLVQQKVHRLADAVHMLPHKGECHRANCMLASYCHETNSNSNRSRVSGNFCYPAARAQSGHAGTDEACECHRHNCMRFAVSAQMLALAGSLKASPMAEVASFTCLCMRVLAGLAHGRSRHLEVPPHARSWLWLPKLSWTK